jgi:hypothetical protein
MSQPRVASRLTISTSASELAIIPVVISSSARRPAVAELRLADMDRDGVSTQAIFGPIFQISTDDPVLRAACYRVYDNAAALYGLEGA